MATGPALALLLLALCTAVASTDLRAQTFAQQPSTAPESGNDAGGLDRREAARIARQRSGGGRVLSAEPAFEKGRRVYRVKVLTPDGRVRVLVIPDEPSR